MLKLDPANLQLEVTRAESFRRKHTARTREIRRRFTGNWYRLDNAVDPTPDNLIADYVTFMLPELAYSSPSVIVQSTRPSEYELLAQFIEMGLDTWLHRSKFSAAQARVAVDFLMGYAVIKVGLEPVDNDYRGLGTAGGALVPFASRVPPDQFIMDPRCEDWSEARYLGHRYRRDLDDLEAQPDRWDPDGLAQLSANADDEERGNLDAGDDERPFGPATIPPRNQVTLVDLWIKETQQLITLGAAGKQVLPVILRKVDYEGPRNGPYEVFGCYTVPGDPYPIGPLQFAMEQFEELQAHLGSASEAAKNFKRFVCVNAAADDLANAVQDAESGSVYKVRNFNPQQAMQFDLGGPNPGQLQYIEQTRERWDRGMGMGDAQRGRAAGKTATESQIVQSNVDSRTQYVKSCMVHSIAAVLERVAHYLIHNPLVVMEVSRTDPLTQVVHEGLFLGGIHPGQESIDWSGFSCTVIQDSISRTDNQVLQARAIQLVSLAPQLAQMKASLPGVNVDWLVNLLGEAINYKDLASILFNPGGIAMMQRAAMMQQQAVQRGGPAGLSPAAPGVFNGGGQAALGIGPGSLVFPTNAAGYARPVSARSNGPAAGPGSSPLPRFGMPRTQAVGA